MEIAWEKGIYKVLYNITVFREFRFLMAFLHEIFLYFSMLKKKKSNNTKQEKYF